MEEQCVSVAIQELGEECNRKHELRENKVVNLCSHVDVDTHLFLSLSLSPNNNTHALFVIYHPYVPLFSFFFISQI